MATGLKPLFFSPSFSLASLPFKQNLKAKIVTRTAGKYWEKKRRQNYWELYLSCHLPWCWEVLVCDWELLAATGTQIMSSNITGILTLAKTRQKMPSQCGFSDPCPPVCSLQQGYRRQPCRVHPQPSQHPSRGCPGSQRGVCREGEKAAVPTPAFRGREGNTWS